MVLGVSNVIADLAGLAYVFRIYKIVSLIQDISEIRSISPSPQMKTDSTIRARMDDVKSGRMWRFTGHQ